MLMCRAPCLTRKKSSTSYLLYEYWKNVHTFTWKRMKSSRIKKSRSFFFSLSSSASCIPSLFFFSLPVGTIERFSLSHSFVANVQRRISARLDKLFKLYRFDVRATEGAKESENPTLFKCYFMQTTKIYLNDRLGFAFLETNKFIVMLI